MSTWLIIGIGNPLRRDDGAGWRLAERLAASLQAAGQAVHLRQVQQLLPELAEEIAELEVDAIIFADVAAGATAAQIIPLTPAADPAQGGSHHLGPAMLLFLLDRLYGRRLPAWLATVPGVDFGHGEGLSAAAEAEMQAVEKMVEELTALPGHLSNR